MKRIIAIFLSLAMMLSLFTVVYADTDEKVILDTKLCLDLTSEGAHSITVPSGTEITVTYTLYNATTEGEAFDVATIFNYVYYDHTFFEVVEESYEKVYNDKQTIKVNVWSGDRHEIYINNMHLPTPLDYPDGQVVARFKVKVIAESGKSTISSCYPSIANLTGSYQTTTEDLTVTVGEIPSEPPAEYKVVYMNGDSEYKKVSASEGVITIADGPAAPEGYEFKGWDYNGNTYMPGDTFNLTGDVTFTAKWEKKVVILNYTLDFDTNGGTEVKSITDKEGTVVDLSKHTTSRTGCTFEGWYSDKECTTKVTSVTLDANKTVYAKWKKEEGSGGGGGGGSAPVKYTITFTDPDGTKLDSLQYKENITVDLSKFIFDKDGYVFDGWYTDKELTNKVTSVKITKDLTLYAKWNKKDDTTPLKPGNHPEILTKDHYAYIVGREGGRIEPQANITRAEVATIFFRLLTEEVRKENLTRTNNFSDVADDSWYNTAVSTLASLGIINGRTEDTFAPAAYITRAEFTAIAARFSDAEYNGEDLFADISGHWAQDYINRAASLGWVQGENGIFRPDDKITRAEVMTLVNRVLGRVPESEADLSENMTRWEDNADTSAWYYLAVQEATNSHDYELKADGIHERWLNIKANPNWAEFEK